jgi:hypothetical protein
MKDLHQDIAEMFGEYVDAERCDLDVAIIATRAADAERLREYRQFNKGKNAEYTRRWRNKDRAAFREYHRARRWPGTLTAVQLDALLAAIEAGDYSRGDEVLIALRELQQRRAPTRSDYRRKR